MTSCDGSTLDLVYEVGREFTDVMFTVTNQLQQLRLTDNETFLLKAYVIFDGKNIYRDMMLCCYVTLQRANGQRVVSPRIRCRVTRSRLDNAGTSKVQQDDYTDEF